MKVVFDIDGTLSDPTHRLHHIQKDPKDWDAFFAACGHDAAVVPICWLMRTMQHEHEVRFWTGRPERVRVETRNWLRWAGFAFEPWIEMRKDGDHRPDHIVKPEYIRDGWTPDVIFEDRTRVVEAFRARGIVCVQVAPGDF